MTYAPPVNELIFAMRHVGGLDASLSAQTGAGLSAELIEDILNQAARFAVGVIAPLNQPGDRIGARFDNGRVLTPPGWRDAYAAWIDGGWNGVGAPVEAGGMGLPAVVSAACTEIWSSAALAFSLCASLTQGGIDALAAHGDDDLKDRYLARMASGEWPATMNLTEPQSGSDLTGLRTRAVPSGDGTYRITGQKIFITYGEHDLARNILHLVLARLPDAPEGNRGISLFLVPKILPDGSPNDLRCTGIEHKLGIHGSPTCSMSFGEGGGATGWLIGEANRGLNCMFTMMNNARLVVALQGVAVAERAYQQALAFARDRQQGRAADAPGNGPVPIIEHPDVQRNLLTMKAQTAAARAICLAAAGALDRARWDTGATQRTLAAETAGLLMPVAKALATDIAVTVASLGIQVHGGMGYVEETGAAQHLRDARILPIYEGTNGIQAIDLVTRKLTGSNGAAMAALTERFRAAAAGLSASSGPGAQGPELDDAIASLDRATARVRAMLASGAQTDALAVATPYLRLLGLVAGGGFLAELALAAGSTPGHRHLSAFYNANILPEARGLERIVLTGADPLRAARALLSA